MKRVPQTVTERLLRRVVIDPATGCWNFTGGTRDSKGYGCIGINRVVHYTHRVAYELFVGPLGDGVILHHICDNPKCCNPEHLQPTTRAEHVRELTMRSVIAANLRKAHCPKGHPYTESFVRSRGVMRRRRDCVTCERESARRAFMRDPEKRRRQAREATRRWRAKQKAVGG